MIIELPPKKVFRINLYLILFLLCANIIGIISRLYFNHGFHGVVALFDFDHEKNIPTLYSSATLLCACVLLLLIAFIRKRLELSYVLWAVLSLVFLYLSIDEASSIHERFDLPMRETLKTSGLLYHAWIVPFGAVLVVFTIAYSKFLLELPKTIMILFLVSGAIFVLGAIGFEMLSGWYDELFGFNKYLYALFYTCEETLEMLGIAIFNFTLLTYISSQFESVAITINQQDQINRFDQ